MNNKWLEILGLCAGMIVILVLWLFFNPDEQNIEVVSDNARTEHFALVRATDAPEIDLEELRVFSVGSADQSPEERLTEYFGYVPADWELQEFYQIVMDEAGNTEPEDGIGAVADVIANRCRSDRFPDTIHEVIYQKNQFEPIVAGTFGRFEITDLVYEICDDHISEGAMDTEILFFTAGAYNPYCKPMYVIGNHYFGR